MLFLLIFCYIISMTKKIEKIYYFTLLILSFLAIWGSILYWTYSLNLLARIITIILTIASTLLIYKYSKISFKDIKNIKLKRAPKAIYLLYFITLSFLIYLISKSQSNEALTSPWQVLNSYFFIAYTLLASITLYLTYKNYQGKKIALSIFYLISFSIALFIYKIGYGFDPFIHQASIESINNLGKIEPKTIYYIGQYSIILILKDIFNLSIEFINKFFVPIFSALTIPLALNLMLKDKFKQIKTETISLLALIIPYSIFIISTPQNLAYTFLLLTIILGSIRKKRYFILSGIIALSSLFIHLLAGIPAIIFWFMLTILRYKYKLKLWQTKISMIISSLVAIFIIPLAFIINGSVSTNLNNFNFNLFSSLSWSSGENIWLNLNYFYGFNLSLLIIILILSGTFLWLKKYKKKEKTTIINIILGTSFFISFLLSQFLNFNDLIEYEQSYYRTRLLIISIILLLPVILYNFKYLLDKINYSNKYIKIASIIFIPLILTASLYHSYPRHDNFHNSHGYSLSYQDIETVKFIEKESEDKNYAVLANQQTSLAALKTFGFNNYLKNDLYYYPIPTGGQLYKYYLSMVYDGPSIETIKKARELTGTKEIYFVVSKYWWASKKVIDEASLIADKTYKLFSGDIYVFKYKF